MTRAILSIDDAQYLMHVIMTDQGYKCGGIRVSPQLRPLILCTTEGEYDYAYRHGYRCQLIHEQLLQLMCDLYRTASRERANRDELAETDRQGS